MQRIVTALLLISLLSAVAAAQDDQWYLNKPIADIRFEGLSSISENELLGLMRPYIAKPYTDVLSWEIQGKLYALDYFDIIIPDLIPVNENLEQVILVLHVEEKPEITDVLFTGNNKIRRGELLDTVLVKSGDLLNPGSLRIDEQAIVDFYLEKGFIEATAVSRYEVNDQTNKAVVYFDVVEGMQTKISEIRFVGNDIHVSDSTLRSLMQTKTQSLFNKGLFVETKLQEDIKAIEQYYGDQGFIDAEVEDIAKDIVFDKEENLNKMVITIVIKEGDSWTFGGLTFVGNSIYTKEDLDALVSQKSGETFSRTKFQMDYQRITDQYFENGYIFNTFTYEEKRDPEKRTVSYLVSITERDRAHIENIIIRGNDKTKSYVIRREIPLEEGEVFSKTKIYKGMMNLYNLQYFDAVEPNPYPGSENGLMNLVVDVSEGKTSDIGFGLSFSGGTDFPISGQISWNDRNFLGRGQTLGAEITASPDVQQVTLSFTEPRLFGKRWSGGIDFTWSRRDNATANQDKDGNGIPDPFTTWAEYDAADGDVPDDSLMEYTSNYLSSGINTGYSWITRYGRFGFSTGLRVTWQYVNYDADIYTPYNKTIRSNLDTWKYSDSISLSTSWDTRDLQYDPTKGFRLGETLTYTGILRNYSSKNFIKSVTKGSYNLMLFDIPLKEEEKTFRCVMSVSSAFNALFNKPNWTQDDDYLETDGFYIDGMFVARGWPSAESDYYKYLWDNTLQFKFPLFPNILSFDVFLDAVGAWTANRGDTHSLLDMHANDWMFSLGAGLRFANQQFPIGIYLVKRFQWTADGTFTWFPDDPDEEYYEFNKSGIDIVIAFDMDIY